MTSDAYRPRHDGRIAIFYEHPAWFAPLFAEIDRRGIAYDRSLRPTALTRPIVSRRMRSSSTE